MDERPTPPSESALPFELAPASGGLRLLISLFVTFHVAAIVFWNMPHSNLQMHVKRAIAKYMHYVVLDQGWGMFTIPGRENYFMAARITYDNGERFYWYIGRMDTLNPWERLINERERKLIENLYIPANGLPHYNQMALWALRKIPERPNRTPVKVELTRHWSAIPPLPDGLHKDPVTGWNSDVVYSLGLGKGKKS